MDKLVRKTVKKKKTIAEGTIMSSSSEEAKHRRVEKQVGQWDIYARLMPTVFLLISMGLIWCGLIDFDQAFWLGLGLFSVTAVTWWFWTIFTIRLLVRTLGRASKNLEEVKHEFKRIHKEVKALRDENE